MASAAAVAMVGGNGCAGSSASWFQIKNRRKKNSNDKMGRDGVRFFTAASYSSPSVMDPYKTLRIQPDASESEVKKAFRQLALQYHPDVCRGSNCGVQFSLINEAYDDLTAMSNLREEPDESSHMYMSYEPSDQGIDEPMRGMNDTDWDMWEEWMGWEGAGIRDYSSHVNPYI